ncbi:MAG TPA: monofunctional biosynthetic peptidoglycan transglycosylase [Steroidobacteraceae bacterium]|nr:monofunctional biosynthetic peptidoglycan transglycosylase [Steroidobacteraceae bacterium]
MARKRPHPSRALRASLWFAAAWVLLSATLVVPLRWLNPPIDAFMVESRLASWYRRDPEYVFRHRWVDLRRISPNLALAVVAAEDQKFPVHWGFDVAAIERAYELNQHSHRILGASTISQQVAKNLFLWGGRSYLRKALEAYFTVWLESCWPKRRILEIYLNVAEFGQGTYGAESAAERFFHESAAHLTRSQAALLAAVLPDPERFRVAAPSPYIERRRAWILRQMRALGGPQMLREIDAYPNRRR